jgi:carbon monoxide dehydrogenase subunit G
MIKRILIVVIVLVAAVLVYATTRPNTLHVERATTIKAPPEKIFPLINDFHSWGSWSPYEKKDPTMKRSYSGAARGNGAVYEWQGNSDVGQGRIEITNASPSKVTFNLDFIKPFEGHNITEFTLEPKGDTTRVTWSMDGPVAFVPKVMGIFINMDDMIGQDFEAGLANLKNITEQ